MKKFLILLLLISSALMGQITRNPENAVRTVLADLTGQGLTYASFNGADNYMTAPSNSNFNFGKKDFSISVLLKPKSLPSYSTVLMFGAGNLYLYYNSSGSLYLFPANGSSVLLKSGVITLNTLQHIVITKSANTLTLYKDGLSVATVSDTNNYTSNTTKYFMGNGSAELINANIFMLRLYNYGLSASQVTSLYNNGQPWLYKVTFADKGANNINVLKGDNSTFTTGKGSWTATGSATAEWETDHLKATMPSSGAFEVSLANTLTGGKQYYISAKVRLQSGVATPIDFGRVGSLSADRLTFTPTGTATTYSGVITVASSGYLAFYRATSNGAVYEMDDIVVIPVGCVADYRFNEGNGYQVKDYSGNNLHGTINGTNYPTGAGYSSFWMNSPKDYSQWFEFGDEQISSSAATTTLTRIPPKTKITDITVTVDTVFDGSTTLSLGYSGSDAALATIDATTLTTTGSKAITFTSPAVQTITNERQLYIKKNQATTTGRVRIFIKYEYEGVN